MDPTYIDMYVCVYVFWKREYFMSTAYEYVIVGSASANVVNIS